MPRPAIDRLIADMQATAFNLEAAVQDELERSPTKDPDATDYPPLARSLGARLNNLKATITALEAARPRQTLAT